MKLLRALGVLVVAAFATQVAAQESVTIKIADAKAGDRVRVTEEQTAASTLTTMGRPKKEQSTKTLVYVEECVTPPAEAGKKPLKVIRTYEKITGSKNGEKLDDSLVGKPITIEKKGSKYTFTVNGEDATGAVADTLNRTYNNGDVLNPQDAIPTTPVKPGENWKIDVTKALTGFEYDKLTIDRDAATMTGKLVKAYKKDNVVYGVIEMKASLPITGLGPKNPLTVKPGSGLTLSMAGDGCIDGTRANSESSSKMTIQIETTDGVSLTADYTLKKTTAQLPKM